MLIDQDCRDSEKWTRERNKRINYVSVRSLLIQHGFHLCKVFFRPDAKSTIDEDHPLNALKRDRAAKNIAEMAANLPLDKLDKLESMLEQLENDQT
jgi:hypothetical protein